MTGRLAAPPAVVGAVVRVVGMRGSPADALVRAFSAAAIAVVERLFFDRLQAART